MRPLIPKARTTSALRRPASASVLRMAAWVMADREGLRVRNSVKIVRLARIIAPISAAMPMYG